jgi:3-phosphoshikimate 1-carboxyvinyltransferase
MSWNPMTQKVIAKQVLVVGLGLIGGSFAKALKNNGVCDRVLGSTRSASTLQKALANGVIDWGTITLAEAAAQLHEGDVVLLATPTLTVPQCLSELKDVLMRGVIVTDAASVKGDLAAKAVKLFGRMPAHLVLGHPIAGSEKSGIDAINENLYQNHRVILTPSPETNRNSLGKVVQLWESVGAIVSEMSVEEHDRILAATSHLPHVLAFSLVDALAKRSEQRDIFTYASGGFRDFTRIAGSDPQMWHDIVLANREAILAALDDFENSLDQLRQAIDARNGHRILQIFTEAKAARDKFSVLLVEREKNHPAIKKT